MERYGIIREKNPREIILLRGNGCKWRRCTFCDYHLDASEDEESNFELNKSVLEKVTGEFGRLEIINSGSFTDLNEKTIEAIRHTTVSKGIASLHIECHWIHRAALHAFSKYFAEAGVEVIYKIGIETFNIPFREKILKKGMGNATPEEIAAAGFKEINLLCGVDGQTSDGIRTDIETGLRYFDRVCVNVMTANTTKIQPSKDVIDAFIREIFPLFKDNNRVDILLENTDFGVG